jgi:DNA-binding transcriptional LysR family regulator
LFGIYDQFNNGPWVYVAPASVPYVLLHVPPDFRAREYQRIPYGELNRNWRTWERGRYWEKHDWGRRDLDRERHQGVALSYREREGHGR